VSDKRFRDLEREAILGDESLSWEKKMREISELFKRYAGERDALRSGGEEGV